MRGRVLAWRSVIRPGGVRSPVSTSTTFESPDTFPASSVVLQGQLVHLVAFERPDRHRLGQAGASR